MMVAHDKFLQEVCNLNAISREQLEHQNEAIEQLELFLIKCYKIQSLHHFSNLKRLVIMSSCVEKISNLDSLVTLECLWLNENAITRIEGLDNLKKLRELYLHGNRITKVEGLDRNLKLEVLWLNDNNIRTLDGLERLLCLKTLWIGNNPIEKIGNCLDNLQLLEELNIAGCKIGHFKEIPYLDKLGSLTSLKLKCPMFGENPVCSLSNYQTYALHNLSSIRQLDGKQITDAEREMIDTTFLKKKMYYNMRIKTLKRNSSNIIQTAEKRLNSYRQTTNRELDSLLRMKQEISEEIRQVSSQSDRDTIANSEYLDQLHKKNASVTVRIKDLMEKQDTLDDRFRDLKEHINSNLQRNISRLLIELDTGGNIRLEEGKRTDVWYQSCIDLVKSRFYAKDFQSLKIHGLQITRVTRIHNRSLRPRFEQQLESMVDTSDSKYKNSLEYLFYGESLCEHQPDITSIIEDGFRPVSHYENKPWAEGGVPLSNSVSICEMPRLSTDPRLNSTEDEDNDKVSIMGSLLIAKVFLGSFTQVTPSRMAKNAKRTNGVRASREHKNEIIRHSNGKAKLCQQNYPKYDSVYRAKGGNQKQRHWYIFDHSLILPEYLVEYELLRKETNSETSTTPSPELLNSQASSMSLSTGSTVASSDSTHNANTADTGPRNENTENLQDSIASQINMSNTSDAADNTALGPALLEFYQLCSACEKQSDEILDILAMPPALRKSQGNPISVISEYAITSMTHMDDFSTITYLNLYGNGITSIENLNKLVQLKTLVLSFNDIQKMEGLTQLHSLEVLELGHNHISTVSGLETLKRLRRLGLNNNSLNHWVDINAMIGCVPSMTELNMRGNAICQLKNYRSSMIRDVKTLISLDEWPVRDDERELASKCNHLLTYEMIQQRSSINRIIRHSLGQSRLRKLDGRMVEHLSATPSSTSGWASKIVDLDLSSANIRVIENLDHLVNLKALSLADNEITRITGLENCLYLQELNLEDNGITKIEGLSALLNLRRLDLGRNKISKLTNLDLLIKLNQLSLEDNNITSLKGIEHLAELMELYMANNGIVSLKEVQTHLSAMPRLVILDLFGNDATNGKNYRLSTVFQLKRLKVLDGISVDSVEQSLAKKEYHGRLTVEVLSTQVGHDRFEIVTDLDLSNLDLCVVDALSDHFPKLTKLNLGHNQLRSLRGLKMLETLVVLQLSQNKLDTSSNNGAKQTSQLGQCFHNMAKLEVLQMDGNHISSIPSLHLHHLNRLRSLSLRNNGIQRIDGLNHLPQLQELYLDRNKIRAVGEGAFTGCPNLQVLSIKENVLRSLDNIKDLTFLHTLHLGSNRIMDVTEIDMMTGIIQLRTITMNFNPITRKSIYRPFLVVHFPTLVLIDNKEVTMEEREKAAFLFRQDMEQSAGTVIFKGNGSHASGVGRPLGRSLVDSHPHRLIATARDISGKRVNSKAIDTGKGHQSPAFIAPQRVAHRQTVRITPLSLQNNNSSFNGTGQSLSSVAGGRSTRGDAGRGSVESTIRKSKPRKDIYDVSVDTKRLHMDNNTARRDSVIGLVSGSGIDFASSQGNFNSREQDLRHLHNTLVMDKRKGRSSAPLLTNSFPYVGNKQ